MLALLRQLVVYAVTASSRPAYDKDGLVTRHCDHHTGNHVDHGQGYRMDALHSRPWISTQEDNDGHSHSTLRYFSVLLAPARHYEGHNKAGWQDIKNLPGRPVTD